VDEAFQDEPTGRRREGSAAPWRARREWSVRKAEVARAPQRGDEAGRKRGCRAGATAGPARAAFRQNEMALDLKALDLKALDLKALDLKALDLKALDLKALDLKALGLKAASLAERNGR